jgi:large subunit ribosomal protein L25
MCPPDRIPAQFDVNLEGLEIGRSVHISAVPLPEGVLPTIRDRDFTVATIAGAAAMKPEVEEGAPVAAEGAEPGEAAAAAPEAGAEGAKAPSGKEAAGKSEDKSEKGGKK